jgi:nicotinamide-nucleotide amidase
MTGGTNTVDRVAGLLVDLSWSLAVAESLTGGLLASRFAAGPEASSWFLGGVVAYTRETKQKVLGAGDGPLVSEQTAVEMAQGVASLLGARVSVAVTGAGGPQGHDGAEPGEVWLAVRIGDHTRTQQCQLDGGPEAICEETCELAVSLLGSTLAQVAAVG